MPTDRPSAILQSSELPRNTYQEPPAHVRAQTTPPFLFVGEAAGKWVPGSHRPLWPHPANSAGGRLLKYSGLTMEEYVHGTERVNLFLDTPKKWSKVHAEQVAKSVAYYAWARGQVLVLLGKKVASAFGLPGLPFDMDWVKFQLNDEWTGTRFAPKLGSVYAVVIPHTSGRCRDWNDPKVKEDAERFFAIVRGQVRKYLRGKETSDHWDEP